MRSRIVVPTSSRRCEVPVELHGGDSSAELGQRERQRAEAGADLEHVVARTRPAGGGDAPGGVRVDEEVLPERAAGRDAVLLQQRPDAGRPQRHAVTARRWSWSPP
jgi:hypothetical protein